MSALKGKSGESLRQMVGNKPLMQTMLRSKEVLDQIIAAEEGYRDELEMVAIQMVTDAYPIVDYANIKIIASIGNDMDIEMNPNNEDPATPDFGTDDPEKMKAKRRIINGITQGASVRGAFGFMLFREYLDQINPDLVSKYNEILKLVFGIYDDENAIAMMLAAISQGQKMQGGESEMEYDDDQINRLVKSYYGKINQSIVSRVNLQGVVSDIMWSLWSYVQAEKSVLEFDYKAHGTYRLERAINKIESKEYELWKNNI